MKWGRLVMGIAGGRRRRRKFVNFAITAVLAFNRRGFVVRRGSVIVAVAWGRRRRRGIKITRGGEGEGEEEGVEVEEEEEGGKVEEK